MMINENSSELMETADSNYESIRKKLVLRLFHQQGNEAIMDQYPCRKVLDLFLICEIQQEWESEDEASTAVTKEMLKQWNIPEDKLFEDAMEAAPRNEPYNFRKIEDVLMEYKADMVFPKAEDVSLYVATTNSRYWGACVMVYPDFLRDVALFLGQDFYIIPSSVHEVLILPGKNAPTVENLNNIIAQINEKLLDPFERLSNQVYLCTRAGTCLTIAK